MEFLSTILSLLALVVFCYLCVGAYLLMKDSEIKWQIRKELRAKYPDLNRDQIRVLSYIKLKEMWEKGNVK